MKLSETKNIAAVFNSDEPKLKHILDQPIRPTFNASVLKPISGPIAPPKKKRFKKLQEKIEAANREFK